MVDFGLAVKVPKEWGDDPVTINAPHKEPFDSIASLEETEISPNRMLNKVEHNSVRKGVRMKLKPAGTPRTLP